MRKLLAALGLAVGALALAWVLGSVRWRPAQRDGAPALTSVARGGGPLLAGAAVVPLDPPPPVLVAGFPKLRWEAEGARDPVAVRALALREPGCTVVLVSLELLLVPGDLADAVRDAVRDLGVDRLVVAATHTHAGPGGWWDEALGERIATGPYRPAVRAHVVERSARAVREAVGALRPATVAVARGAAPDLARNRRGGAVDGRLTRLVLREPDGPAIAEVVVLASHATLLGSENRRLSGDWPGALMRTGGAPALFFQGAVGDQSPLIPDGGDASPEAYAARVRRALDALALAPPDAAPALSVAVARTVLPAPTSGAAPAPLRRLIANVLYGLLPERAEVTAVQLGPVTLAAVPAEPVEAVGRAWREAAGPSVELIELAGDYLGYVETRERMAEASGETVRTYYGPELARRLGAAVALAARAAEGDGSAAVGVASGAR